ncbi:MAG: potassium transporter TrkH [Eubacterium sp.]|nr:potassium transporter TrkH [Eubacterium sp.]
MHIRISSERLIPVSFLMIIIIGTILLMLPFSSATGEYTNLTTALFTSTTSVCVTGLVVVDTFSHWSAVGQGIILVLVQIGGLGVVTLGAFIMLIGRRKFSLEDRMILEASLNVERRKGLLSFLIRIFKGTLLVEAIGAVLYAIKLVPMHGVKGIWESVFQSVSAFCNAGMDVIGPNSMIDFQDSNYMMIITMTLIVLGGLGFVVWFDVIDGVLKGIRNKFSLRRIIRNFSEHTKLVIILTISLLLMGTVVVFIAEYNNPYTIGNMGLGGKLRNSLFQSVTFRTAGFASVSQDKLTDCSCLAGYVLMFIGGSPIGTAGGVKTVTIFLILMNTRSFVRNRNENVVFRRSIPETLMRKAAAIVFVSFFGVMIMTSALIFAENIGLTDALYEIVSALATVGLSRGVTPNLDTIGRLIVIVSMFLGRIGPISMAIFFSKGSDSENKIKHAEGTFYVG